MPISSLIVRTRPGEAARLALLIEKFDGATVSHVENDLMVTLTEQIDIASDKKLWERIESLEGVLAADVVYHNFEDLEGVDQ
jgi:nitrate reductase NapAB chaperone NapD